jgi:hypothetical protein
LALCVLLPQAAAADTLTLVPADSDFNNFDHEYMYAWYVPGLQPLLQGKTISKVEIKIENIENWNSNENYFFMHLLDKVVPNLASGSGVSTLGSGGGTYKVNSGTSQGLGSTIYTFQDEPNGSDLGPFIDDFARDDNGNPAWYTDDGLKFFNQANPQNIGNSPLGENHFGGAGDAYGFITETGATVGGQTKTMQLHEGAAIGPGGNATHSFTSTPQDYTYTFNAGQLTDFKNFVQNNGTWDFALAIDPDCHFDNDGLKIVITYSTNTQVPEPAGLTLMGLGFMAFVGIARRRRKQQ